MKEKVKSKTAPPSTSEVHRRSLDSIPDSNDSLDTDISEKEKSTMSTYMVKLHLFLQKFSSQRISALLAQKKASASENFQVLARVMKYMADQKKVMVFAYISLICVAMAQTKMPQLASAMIDSVVLEQSPSNLNKQAINFLIVALIYSVSEYFWGHLFDILCNRIREKLKHQVYSSVIQKEIGFFDKKSLNEVLYYINTQIDWVQNVCTNRFSSFGRNFIQLVYSAWMLAFISYKLTLFLFLIVPVNLMLAFGYSRVTEKIVTKERESFLKTNRRVTEAFQNIRIVKAYSTEDLEIEEYGDLMKNDMRHSRLFSLANASHAALTGFFSNFTLLCIVFIGMSLVNSGDVTPGTLSGFLIYSISVSISFRDAGNSYARIKESIPFCREFFQLLDDAPRIKYKGGKTIENFQGKIELNQVAFRYPTAPDVTILKNVSLTINPGESVAFVGMSGGGKSTIVSILLRFYDIANGEVTFDGVNLQDLDLKWVHDKIGYVSQEPILFSGTFEENLTYGMPSYTHEKVLNAIKMANADFIFDEKLFPNGLKSDIGERGSRLSGGQKQRLAIARALIREPKILIFDEATSNLDTNSEFEVQKAIDNLISTGNITTVTIAHRLSTILKCKVIYVIKSGEIIEKGSHQELVAQNGAYRTLVEKQLKTLH